MSATLFRRVGVSVVALLALAACVAAVVPQTRYWVQGRTPCGKRTVPPDVLGKLPVSLEVVSNREIANCPASEGQSEPVRSLVVTSGGAAHVSPLVVDHLAEHGWTTCTEPRIKDRPGFRCMDSIKGRWHAVIWSDENTMGFGIPPGADEVNVTSL